MDEDNTSSILGNTVIFDGLTPGRGHYRDANSLGTANGRWSQVYVRNLLATQEVVCTNLTNDSSLGIQQGTAAGQRPKADTILYSRKGTLLCTTTPATFSTVAPGEAGLLVIFGTTRCAVYQYCHTAALLSEIAGGVTVGLSGTNLQASIAAGTEQLTWKKIIFSA